MKKKIGIVLLVIIMVVSIVIVLKKDKRDKKVKVVEQEYEILEHNKSKNRKVVLKEDFSFDVNLINEMGKYDEKTNYLISPYSIEVALNMLKQGASNNTYKEIENLIGSRKINDISIKDRISVTNGLFIKNEYKTVINNNFINSLLNDYNSDIIYDDFNTPDVINKWVKKSTKGMIPKILEQVDPNFVLGIGNALAIDVNWYNTFDCVYTVKDTFTKEDNTTYEVEMMHQSYRNNIEYFETDNSKGVIIPYSSYNVYTGEEFSEEDEVQLEFVAVLPKDGVSNYIKDFSEEEISAIGNNKHSLDKKLDVSIPRFEYDYDLGEFKNLLMDMGIKEMFNPDGADFSKIIDKDKQTNNLYVGQAIHKTHISFNEKGTKAAAITFFAIGENAAILDEEEPDVIKFDKPFVYMIRDKESKELLFFGVVYEPSKWKGSTCDE